MNNIVKSVVFAAVVLFAGIAAMQVIYKNQDGSADITAVEPAAGEAGVIVEGQPATSAETVSETVATPTDDQAEAARDAIEADADAAKEAVDAEAEKAKEAVEEKVAE